MAWQARDLLLCKGRDVRPGVPPVYLWRPLGSANQLHLELMGFKPLLNIFWNRLGMSVPLGPACRTPPPGGLLQRHALDVETYRITMFVVFDLTKLLTCGGYPVL